MPCYGIHLLRPRWHHSPPRFTSAHRPPHFRDRHPPNNLAHSIFVRTCRYNHQQSNPTSAPLAPTTADSATPDASLRVAVSPIPGKEDTSLRVVAPSPTPPRRTVQLAPLPSDTLVATFSNSTGLQGKQRRKAQRKRPHQRPLSAAKTTHPTKRNVVAPPASSPIQPVSPPQHRPPRRHSHGTRLASRLRHVSGASARHIILAAARAAQTTPSLFALHGNAFNPDTGNSPNTGNSANAVKAHFGNNPTLTKSAGSPKDMAPKKEPTMYFIKVGDIPKGRKATYL